MQKPHCRPCASRNASCSGCSASSPGDVSPSTVVDRVPSACTANIRHDAHRLAVEQHGAGAAHAVLAADVGAGQAELVAQEVAEQEARLDLGGMRGAVDRDGDANAIRHRATRAESGSGASSISRLAE